MTLSVNVRGTKQKFQIHQKPASIEMAERTWSDAEMQFKIDFCSMLPKMAVCVCACAQNERIERAAPKHMSCATETDIIHSRARYTETVCIV